MLENLKVLREESGTTQKQLAEAVSVSQQSINKYENHNIEPDIATLIRIADYFHTSVDYLIGHSTSRNLDTIVYSVSLTPEEMKLIHDFKRLSSKEKQSICLIFENYLANKKD